MRLPRFEYVKPTGLQDVLDILQEHGKKAAILAGGSDLLINMKYRVVQPEKVVNIKELKDLDYISSDNKDGVEIGAGVNLSALATSTDLTETFPAFGEAVRSVASKHIRNLATIGGNICLDNRCWYYNQSKLWRDSREVCFKLGGRVCHAIKGSERCHAINSSDSVPILIALGARVKVVKKGGERIIPLKDFFVANGAKPNVLEPDEMVSSLLIPKNTNGCRSAFIKVAQRKGIDFALGSIAAYVKRDGKEISELQMVLGTLASTPIVLKKAAQVIKDSGLNEASIEMAALTARSELGPLTNLFTSAGYKRHLAEVLVKRALVVLDDTHEKKRRSKK
jgi:4-hydroxybenzoyl-CoA reductase beta subunit